MDFWRDVATRCGAPGIGPAGLKVELNREFAESRIRPYLEQHSPGPVSYEERRELLETFRVSVTHKYREFQERPDQAVLYLYWLWVWPHDHTWKPLMAASTEPGTMLDGFLNAVQSEPAALYHVSGRHYVRNSVAHGSWQFEEESGMFFFRDGGDWQELDALSLRIKAAVAHLLLRALYRL